MRQTTLNLPEELVSKAEAYAASHGTTMTALVRSHLEAVTSGGTSPPDDDPLLAYSMGRLSRRDAIKLLGLRDYAGLLILLGDADLPIPRPSAQEIEDQAALFEKLWRQG
jgi:plasmid stability protein